MAARTPAKSSPDLELGYVSGVFGVRGELRLFLHNRESDFLDRVRAVTLVSKDGSRREVRLGARSGAGRKVIGRIEGLDDREQAEALVGCRIVTPTEALPDPGDDGYYVHAVIGSEVRIGEDVVGTVSEVHQSGPTDVFEVSLVRGGVGYVPVLKSHVLEIDAAARRVVLAPDALATDE